MNYKRKYKKYKRIALFLSKAIIVFILVFTTGISVFANAATAVESVNLREKPSTESKVLKLVPMGYEVEIIDAQGEWTKVKFDGSSGYVKSEFLEKVKNSDSSKNSGSQSSESQSAAKSQSSSSASEASSGSLKNGSEGSAVKEFQQLMKDLGYYDGPVNGKFGPLTEEAVKEFQQKANLTVDGVAGSETLAKLHEKKSASSAGNVSAYRNGDEGAEIKKIQTALKEKGFYTGPVNGKFGPMTEEAIKSFQKSSKIEIDGIAGIVTLDLLYAKKANSSSSNSSASSTSKSSNGDNGGSKTGVLPDNSKAANGVELTKWADAKEIVKIGETLKIYDIKTGITYKVKSFSNGLHADVEPVTKADTELLKETYGGVWSWDPRPVWVTIGKHKMAASINGMPHGGGVNDDNGMDGQVCLHFLGSSTHNGNKAFAQLHQDAVIEAWNAANKK